MAKLGAAPVAELSGNKVLIETKGTEFEQNRKPYAIIDKKYRAGKPIMLSEEEKEAVLAGVESDKPEETE